MMMSLSPTFPQGDFKSKRLSGSGRRPAEPGDQPVTYFPAACDSVLISRAAIGRSYAAPRSRGGFRSARAGGRPDFGCERGSEGACNGRRTGHAGERDPRRQGRPGAGRAFVTAMPGPGHDPGKLPGLPSTRLA